MDKTELRVDPEFANKIPPIGDEEFKQLRENILAAGEVYEPIVVWNGIIVDGHNRWKVIQEHPEVKWRVREMMFKDRWDAYEWMYKNQLGRRNLTDEQRDYTIGKMLEARKHSGNQYTEKSAAGQNDRQQRSRKDIKAGTAGEIGKEVGISEKNVRRAEKFAHGVDAVREVSPEAADKILSGKSKLAKQDVREINNMSQDEVKEVAEAVIADKPMPNKWAKPNTGRSAENRALYDMVSKASDEIVSQDTLPTYDINSLEEEVEENGNDYIAKLHKVIEDHHDLIDTEEARTAIKNTINRIAQQIIKEMHNL